MYETVFQTKHVPLCCFHHLHPLCVFLTSSLGEKSSLCQATNW